MPRSTLKQQGDTTTRALSLISNLFPDCAGKCGASNQLNAVMGTVIEFLLEFKCTSSVRLKEVERVK